MVAYSGPWYQVTEMYLKMILVIARCASKNSCNLSFGNSDFQHTAAPARSILSVEEGEGPAPTLSINLEARLPKVIGHYTLK